MVCLVPWCVWFHGVSGSMVCLVPCCGRILFNTIILHYIRLVTIRYPQEQFGSLEVAVNLSTDSLRIGIIKAVGLMPVDLSGTLGKSVF